MSSCKNPNCQNEVKRLNGKFCSLLCKNTVNNALRRKVDTSLKEDLNRYRNNYKILIDILQGRDSIEISASELLSKGFKSKCISAQIKNQIDGMEYHKIGSCAYRYSSDQKKVIIKKLKDELY